MLILISDAFDESLPSRLVKFGEVTSDTGRLPEADVVLIRSKTKATREYLDKAAKLKLIIRGGVGLDNVDQDYAKERGVAVRNTPEASSVAVAELTLTLMLAAINKVVMGHNGMQEKSWLKKKIKRTELFRKTLGLLGAGRIATEVAKRATAFEMSCIGHDPHVTDNAVISLTTLEDVLERSDILSLHMPLTDDTRGLLGSERIARLKPGVVVVNTARGPIVDEVAIAAALREGHVACYATDVWSSDPPPSDCVLYGTPNVLMTPHIGASSAENLSRIGDQVVQIIERFAN